MTLDFTPGDAAAAAAGEHAAAAEGGSGTVTVRGAAAAPTPCHTLSGEAAESGGGLVLRVAVSPDPDAMCAQVIASLGYTAVLRGVPAGEHALRVVHTYPGSGWDEHEALSTRVTVR